MISVIKSSNTSALLSLGNGVRMEFTLEVGQRSVEKIVDGIPTRRHMRRNEKIVVAPHVLRRARYCALIAILRHHDTLRELPEKPRPREFQLSLL